MSENGCCNQAQNILVTEEKQGNIKKNLKLTVS